MIYDDIENIKSYSFPPGAAAAFEFIKTLSGSTPDGRYCIDGEKVYASVMTYKTLKELPEKLERHSKYVDIQSVISGEETLCACSGDSLLLHTAYNAEKDCAFFNLPENKKPALLHMKKGNFALFFPQDAHIGKFSGPLDAQDVKKVVIKISVELFS